MAHFIIERFQKPLGLDISDKCGGLLVYVRSYLLYRQLTKFEISFDFQAIPFEVNMRKEKWLFLCTYKPPSMNSQYFLDSFSDIIDYDNHIVIVIYRNYKHFQKQHFESDLKSSLNNCSGNFDVYEKAFTSALNSSREC